MNPNRMIRLTTDSGEQATLERNIASHVLALKIVNPAERQLWDVGTTAVSGPGATALMTTTSAPVPTAPEDDAGKRRGQRL
jgi:hypothetical protein